MNLDKQKAFIIHVLYVALILGIGYIVIKYLLPLLMPFIIGLILAIIFRRLIDLIEKKTRVRRSIVSILILLVFYGVIVLLTGLLGLQIFTFLKDLFGRLPDLYRETIEPALKDAADSLILQYPGIEESLEDFILNINDTIKDYVTDASAAVIGAITGMAGRIPSLLIKLIFTIVSSFFFTIDYYKITGFVIKQFKGEKRDMILRLKDNGIGTIGKFIRAYSIIISITFLELSIGFLILGIPNPLLLAPLIAFIDILPIIGTGAVLIPWSLIAFIIGNTRIGIGVLILYLVITAVRQAIEPKIVGSQIGLHPILTLVLMYVGAQLMGVLGLLLLPVIATIIKKMNDEGTLQLYR